MPEQPIIAGAAESAYPRHPPPEATTTRVLHTAAAQRQHATHNPGAAYRTPLTIDEYLNAPLIAAPLCIYDCVPVVTGADAVVIKRATHGVAIKAIELSFNPDDQNGDGLQTGLKEL